MQDKLNAIEAKYSQIEARLAAPETYDDPALVAKLNKEQTELQELVETFRAYRRMQEQKEEAQLLLPDRNTLGMIWRYLAGLGTDTIQESPMCLCRKIVRWTGMPLSLGQMMTCLDIFSDVNLLKMQRYHKYITIRLMPRQEKADLAGSQTMQRLIAAKES